MADVEDLQRSLALAKAGLVAPEGARARVRARLAGSVPASLAQSVPASVRVLSRPVRARAWTAGLMGLSFVAGYWLRGAPASIEQPAAEQPGETVAAELQVDPARPMERAAQLASPKVLESAEQTAAAALMAGDTQREEQAKRRRRAVQSSTAASRGAPDRRLAGGPEAADSLVTEVALLQRVERAIRAGEGELALALLSEHEHDYPASSLREERTAARVLAACVARPGSEPNASARAHARRYLAGRELSVYADRVRTLCEIDRAAKPEEAPSAGH